MKSNLKTRSWTIVFVFIFLIFAFSTPAQKRVAVPFDFNDKYYLANGVNPDVIVSRRTGFDRFSVFSKTTDPTRTHIRVLVTVPAYDQNAQPIFWYPLGELRTNGFTDDKAGALARQTASLFPIYIFPDLSSSQPYVFAGNRQAPLIDDSWTMYMGRTLNPLGIREIRAVTYTEKAHTKLGYQMLIPFMKKNGRATDEMPIINSAEDIDFLYKNELIKIEPRKIGFAISPVISNPTRGAIAADAFLWMATTKGGYSLPAEQMFELQFTCLQKTGDWCE